MSSQPRYTPDELILMLDFVLGRKTGEHRSVEELSGQLRALPANASAAQDPGFRNAQGLGSSLGHMSQIDAGEGDWPIEHQHHGRPELRPHFKAVWRQFGRDPDALQARVTAIRQSADAAEEVEDPDFDEGFIEGRSYYALHRRYERSDAARRLKKQSAPVCEVCGFDFGEQYGSVGQGYIECHHVEPLARSGPRTTYQEDLVLVCANCHRMLHRGAPPPSVRELAKLARDGDKPRSGA